MTKDEFMDAFYAKGYDDKDIAHFVCGALTDEKREELVEELNAYLND